MYFSWICFSYQNPVFKNEPILPRPVIQIFQLTENGSKLWYLGPVFLSHPIYMNSYSYSKIF